MDRRTRQRAAASLAHHAPELAEAAVEELGHGLDHAVLVAEGLALRLGDGDLLEREARLLEVLGGRLSVPVPATRFVDVDRGVWAYALLPGTPLLGRVPGSGAARALGTFLRELHGTDPALVDGLLTVDDADPIAWIEDLEGPDELVDLVRASLPPPTRRRVVTHSDLGAEHLLDQDGRITGVIDWSDAALADPAIDLARLYRDFGPVFLEEVLDAYGAPQDVDARARTTFYARCAALEDLAHGRASGREEYTRAAEHSITWLFRER